MRRIGESICLDDGDEGVWKADDEDDDEDDISPMNTKKKVHFIDGPMFVSAGQASKGQSTTAVKMTGPNLVTR